MNGRARSRSAGSGAGNGCTRSSRNEPSNISRTKLGACHSFSRAASATSRASCSEARGVCGCCAGWTSRTSVMADGGGEGGGDRPLESGEPVKHQADDVPAAPLQVLGVLQRDADRGRDGAGVDQVEPAQGDDAEQQLRRLARGCVVQAQLGADGGKRLLARGEVADLVELGAAVERLALDQTDEIGAGRQEVEVIGDGAGEDCVGALARWPAPAPGRPGPPPAPRRSSGPARPGTGRPWSRRSSPACRGRRRRRSPTSLRLVASKPLRANNFSAASRMAARLRSGLRSRSERVAMDPRCGLLVVQQVREWSPFRQELYLQFLLEGTEPKPPRSLRAPPI